MLLGYKGGGNLLEGFVARHLHVFIRRRRSNCSHRRQLSSMNSNSKLWICRPSSASYSISQNRMRALGCTQNYNRDSGFRIPLDDSSRRRNGEGLLCHYRIAIISTTTNSGMSPFISTPTWHSRRNLSNKVPKEVIETIKSEVDEMESLTPSPTRASSSSSSDAAQIDARDSTIEQFTDATKVKKTQDDFAQYLSGEGKKEDENDFDFVQRRQQKLETLIESPVSSLTESGSSSMLSKSSEGSSEKIASTNNDEGQQQQSNTTDNESLSSSSTESISGSLYQYKFAPSDATLTDPQRHVDRRRAMERKLQEQQAVSRATTTQNVQRALAGNFVIATAKLAAAISSGSSAMLSEFVHSVVDCGNQALLLVGLNSSQQNPDKSHPYGYGKAIYFWALVSALGTFFLGAGVSMTHAVGELMNPSMTTEVPLEVWGVLGMSFVVDGYVFGKTLQGVRASMRIDGQSDGQDEKMSFWKYTTTKVRDPATLAVLLEDGAACLGVVLAIGGIGMTQYTGLPIFDGMAGIGISALLGAMGIALVNVNHRYLIGHGVDKTTREDIEQIILSRRSIDNVHAVQTQWTGPDTFSYKAEVDFDGTFLAAKLMPRYQQEFFDAKDTLDRDLRVLLAWYAEDVMRAVEREIRHIEEEIRKKHPSAQYIELEPMSKDADRYAIDDGMKAQLRRVEIEVLNRYLKSLYKIKEDDTATPNK